MARSKSTASASNTAMPEPTTDNLVVVDGSNIATEGRQLPSLAQLNEAVLSFRAEQPDVQVTVVVDATFGHRIDKSEVDTFEEAVAHNELVAPPAGAIGRGDAFVLTIADKSGARILSNDSFQEFHGDYPWLFDEGRLIGGKPVPYVGWVFVNRLPVRGPVSRKARTTARDQAKSRRSASKLASQPMPVPTAPPPVVAPAVEEAKGTTEVATGPRGGPVNELLPFLDFIERNPIGSTVTGTVESYSSHGAYVTIGNLRGYVPLRLMSKPPPRSAREVLKLGESISLMVASLAPTRRSVDLALPGVSDAGATADAPTEAPRRRRKVAAQQAPAAPKAVSKKSAAEKTVPKESAAQEAPAKKTPAKKKAAAEKSSARDAVGSKAPAKKPAVKNGQAKAAPAKPAPAKKPAAKNAPAKQAAAQKARAEARAKKPPVKKAAAKTGTGANKEAQAT